MSSPAAPQALQENKDIPYLVSLSLRYRIRNVLPVVVVFKAGWKLRKFTGLINRLQIFRNQSTSFCDIIACSPWPSRTSPSMTNRKRRCSYPWNPLEQLPTGDLVFP
jgi:hypothetical protein